MDFGFLPPEINSARMYSGPGSVPLLAAAGSWDSLAAELDITAEFYESVLSGLTSLHWRGPASVAMAATAAPYVGWLHITAEQTKQTAMQARAAAAAYEQAYAMTVPPPAVTANRTQLASLIATNLLGQNTAAIAATEAQYAEYWAQDATAMYGYAAGSATALQLTPFSSPHQTTNAAGLTAQDAAVAQAKAAADATSPVSQDVSTAVESLEALIVNPSSIIPEDVAALDVFTGIDTLLTGTWDMSALPDGIIGDGGTLGVFPKLASAPAQVAPTPTAAARLCGGAGLANVTATLGRTGTIGSMSVPASWAAAPGSPITGSPGSALTVLPTTGEPAGSASGMQGVPGMPGGRVSQPTGVVPRYGRRLTVMARPPAAG